MNCPAIQAKASLHLSWWLRRGSPHSLTFPQPFYQAKVAGHHRRGESRCMPQKTTIGLCTFLDSNTQMDGGPGNNQKRRKPICYSGRHTLCQFAMNFVKRILPKGATCCCLSRGNPNASYYLN